jgi:hypothetical protein
MKFVKIEPDKEYERKEEIQEVKTKKQHRMS